MMLLFSLLLSAGLVACISAQSPLDDPILEKIWEEFKERNNIKGNADIDFQTIRNGASFMKLGEKWTSLLAQDLEAVDILAPGASIIVDGTARVPRPKLGRAPACPAPPGSNRPPSGRCHQA